jgi:hypothetical protein
MAADPKRFDIERKAEEIARAEGFSWELLMSAEMCANLFRLKAEEALRSEQKPLIRERLRSRLLRANASAQMQASRDLGKQGRLESLAQNVR